MSDEMSSDPGDAGGEQPVADAPSQRARTLREEMLGSALTLDEVSYILSLDRTTVAKYLREQTIVGFQIGREWLVTEQELRRYMQGVMEGHRGQRPQRTSELPGPAQKGILAQL